MNNRIKLLRKTLGLTQENFAQKIGITKSSVSLLESGQNKASSQTIYILCKEFNVNEKWLRNGTGEMFIEKTTFSLDEYAQASKLTKTEISIIRGFMELDPATRQAIYNIFANAFNENNAAIPDDPQELEKLYPPIDENSDVG